MTVGRRLIRIRSVTFAEPGADVGYIKIKTFNALTAKQLGAAIDRISNDIPRNRLKGYILDLRNDPGGLFDQAVAVSSMFLDGDEYGIELFYPYANELHVTKKDGKVQLDGDFGPSPSEGLQWPPFRAFGETSTPTSCCSISMSAQNCGAYRTAPALLRRRHRYGPIAVPALLRTEWWPMISFIVFKAPPEGTVHIFRPGEPMLQILIVPAEPEFTLIQQTPDEQAQREVRGRRIHASRETLGRDSTWTSSTDTVSDGTYRFVLRAAKAKVRKDGD